MVNIGCDFMCDKIFEENKLNEIIEAYDECLEDLELKLDNIFNLYRNYEEALDEKYKVENRIRLINKNIVKPYFARIDFKNVSESTTDVCYIGKVGVSDFDNKIITVDWRAPIASLYYDSNIGETSYLVEDEIINGELLLKRQYNIENKKLLSFNDVDTVSNDELLKPYLGVNSDARLKNIVSTIQEEQNRIIRSSIKNNIIIQGVAGSGKTTVALHRIAYLVYNYRNIFKDNQYMVIGPNKFFINYISSVLPDLDVNNVNQFDLLEFAEHYLNNKIKINQGYSNLSHYKSSLEFMKYIDDYIDKHFIYKKFHDGFKINGIEIISKQYINNIWDELNEKKYECFNKKIDRMILLIKKYLNDNENLINIRINDYFDSKLKNDNIDNIKKERTLFINNYSKNKNSLLKKYLKKQNCDTLKIYNEILSEINENEDKKLYFEDIGPIIYLNYKLNHNDIYDQIKHVVIDEAQDYNEFTFYALKKILKNSTFSIYGDLAQSLYPYRSLSNWEEIKNHVFIDNLEIIQLKKSYRTSIEIMNEANKINRGLNLYEAIPVIRHGDKVEYIKNSNDHDLKKALDKLIDKKLNSIAIIVKSNDEGIELYNKLSNKYKINLINEDNLDFVNGICIITSSLSKGLEFDGVVISNASESNYNSNNVLDSKLLYVSMTRAIHNLIVLYNNELNKFLV